MHIRIFGFSFNKSRVPRAVGPSEIFSSLCSKSNLESDDILRFGITKIRVTVPPSEPPTDWYAGVILKVRDSRRFTKLTQQKGKKLVVSELLVGGESLAEANCFIAHPTSGAGLYTHHHRSASLNSDLAKILLDEFRRLKAEGVRRLSEDDGIRPGERKQKMKDYAGYLQLQQIILDKDFKDLVATMKQVQLVRVRLATLESGKRRFGSYNWAPKTETIEYRMPPNAVACEVAEGLELGFQNQEFTTAHVEGMDENGHHRSITRGKNAFILDELDYDAMMDQFQLDLSNFGASLRSARLVDSLFALAGRDDIWPMLKAL